MRRLIGLARGSIVGRVALAATAVALAAVIGLYSVTFAVVRSTATRALRTAVDTDLAGLADVYSTGGRAQLAARIDDRLALARFEGGGPHYLLVDAAGRRIAGDLTRWPPLAAEHSQAGYVRLGGGRAAFARATRLGPQVALVVAQEAGGERAMLVHLTWAFAGAGLAVVLIVGLLVRRRAAQLARRVERINAAFRRAGDGLQAAADPDLEPDEIGELARHSGAALGRLSVLVEAQRRVSDDVAHEIRTPLTHLDGRLVALLKQTDNADAATALAAARTDIRGIVALLDSLLDIAASEARRGDPQGLEPFDLSSLAQHVADLYRSSMEEAGLRFDTAIVPGVQLSGEAMQITRLLSNLLDNAIKYVPAGGAVRLEVGPGRLLRVSDDGPGIAPEARPAVFDRFVRGRGDPAAGHGLGLALARAIAERHGMNLRLEGGRTGCSFLLSDEAGR